MFYLLVYMCTMYIPGVLEEARSWRDSLKLELQMVVSCQRGAEH